MTIPVNIYNVSHKTFTNAKISPKSKIDAGIPIKLRLCVVVIILT